MKLKLLDADEDNYLHFVITNNDGVDSNVLEHSNAFYQDLKKMVSLNIGFDEIKQSKELNLVEKSRLLIIQRSLVFPA